MIDPSQMAPAMPPMPGMEQMPGMPQMGLPLPLPTGVNPMQPVDPMMAGMPPAVEQPMPAQPPALLIPDWLIDEIAERNLERENALVDRTFAIMGPPRESVGYSIDQQIAMYLAVPQDLANEDERDEAIYQMREEAMSEDEILEIVHPLRPILFKMAGTTPSEVLRYAKRIHGLAMARLNGLPDPEDPFPGDDEDDDTSDEGSSYDSEDNDDYLS